MRYVSLCNIFLLLLFVLFSRSSPVYQPQKPLDPIADVPDRFKMAPLSPEAMKALPPVRKPPTTHIPIPPTKKPLSVLSRPRRRPGPEPPNTFATQKWEGRLGVMDAKNQARLRSSSDPTPPGSSPWVSGHRHSNVSHPSNPENKFSNKTYHQVCPA
ncbi:hypothetical protein F5887DRAFT_534096 [Amanita rubescens]|nr:hypothetical protein F5887DRAFT_534096 [Amanita rubescens]